MYLKDGRTLYVRSDTAEVYMPVGTTDQPDAGTLDRLRFTSAQAHIRNAASRLQDAIRLDHQSLTLADELAEPWRQAEARNDLAYSYYQAEQLQPARRLSDEALDLARRSGDAVTLDLHGDQLLNLQIDAASAAALAQPLTVDIRGTKLGLQPVKPPYCGSYGASSTETWLMASNGNGRRSVG